jgi:hypothetical protein
MALTTAGMTGTACEMHVVGLYSSAEARQKVLGAACRTTVLHLGYSLPSPIISLLPLVIAGHNRPLAASAECPWHPGTTERPL